MIAEDYELCKCRQSFLVHTDFPLKMVKCEERFTVTDKSFQVNSHLSLKCYERFLVNAHFSLVCEDEESFEVNVHVLPKCEESFLHSLLLNAEDYQLSW